MIFLKLTINRTLRPVLSTSHVETAVATTYTLKRAFLFSCVTMRDVDEI